MQEENILGLVWSPNENEKGFKMNMNLMPKLIVIVQHSNIKAPNNSDEPQK